MKALAIVGFCVLAAVVYGIGHDMVTTRICIEYFTVFHPRVIASEDPTMLALVWGVIATWWMGFGLGIVLAWVARAGDRPKLELRDLVRPIGVLLVVMALLSLTAGALAFFAAERDWLIMPPRWEGLIPAAKSSEFLCDLAAHNAAYATGFFGGLAVMVWAWRERKRREARAT